MSTAVSVWAQVAVVAILFLGGGFAGLGIARFVAPGSLTAEFIGLFSLSLPFAIGMQAWLGLAVVTAAWRAIRRRGQAAASANDARIPPGSFAFVPTCVLLVGMAGVLMALLGSSIGTLATIALYLTLGALYGTACWLYAKNGYLPFPQE
jgi:hypothetical protein